MLVFCFYWCEQFYAQTVGALIGSQLIPVYFPLHQRRRLLVSLTSVLFLFILVFTIVLRYTHNPTAFIPLVFVLFTHSGCVGWGVTNKGGTSDKSSLHGVSLAAVPHTHTILLL